MSSPRQPAQPGDVALTVQPVTLSAPPVDLEAGNAHINGTTPSSSAPSSPGGVQEDAAMAVIQHAHDCPVRTSANMKESRSEIGSSASSIEKDGGIKNSDNAPDDPPGRSKTRIATQILLLIALVAYSIVAFAKNLRRALPLVYIEIAFGAYFACKLFIGTKYYDATVGRIVAYCGMLASKVSSDKKYAIIAALITLGGVGLIIGFSIDDVQRLISLVGLLFFVVGCWVCSWNRRAIKWRPVIGGLLLQFVFGVITLRTTFGFKTFEFIGDKMTALINHTNAGSAFVFNWAATGLTVGNESILPIFAFSILPTVIFFSALVSILYYLGVLQVIIRIIGSVLTVLLGTSVSESLNAAGNIFVGQTEAPLLIRPFLKDMTPSELHAVMTGGFATIAGGVLAIYIGMGISASHLLAASVMSAPAALAISKILYPEDEESKTASGVAYEIPCGEESNVIEAAANGAAVAIQLAINIGGQLIAFLAIISMLNSFLGAIGSLVDVPELSFELICGYILYPVAFLMGVSTRDCLQVATLLGKKIFINEFVAYKDLSEIMISAKPLTERSKAVAVFALCGFANFGSIGIALGGLVPIAPNQSKQLARLVFSAMIAGNVACFMTACIAGVLVRNVPPGPSM